MRKLKAAAILGVLILCGLVILTSLAIAARDPYFAKLTGAFTRGCLDVAAVLPGGSAFFDVCTLVARAVKSLTPSSINVDVVVTAIGDEIGKEMDASNCAECFQFVQDFETTLSVNGTVQGIEDALKAGCEKRFSVPAQADECRALVDQMQIPASVDMLLSDFPPLILCRQLKLCPL